MSQSRLLQLPAELRDAIYELAFSPEAGSTCDLYQAKPLSCALLRSCRQINDEAKSLYHEGCRQYWSSTLLTVKEELGPDRSRFEARLSLLQRHHALGLIRNVEFTICLGVWLKVERKGDRGVWKLENYFTRKAGLEEYIIPGDERDMIFSSEAEALAACAKGEDVRTEDEKAEKVAILLRTFGRAC